MKAYDYSKVAKDYDLVELGGGEGPMTSELIHKILKKYKVKTVLDMTCGTGAQSIGLTKKKYKVLASDISKDMLAIAKRKAKEKKLKIIFKQGDIRTAKYGKFDAVIAMFNAIGHLTKKDFDKAIKNVKENLKEKGIFIFDIFNLDYMKKNFIKHEFIDTAKEYNGFKFVRFNKNKMNVKKGLLHINQKTFMQRGNSPFQMRKEKGWDMQIYSVSELKPLLEKNGFKILQILDYTGKKFEKNKSNFILMVARKK